MADPATVAIVPLRMGGGTRLKILEAMAMGKAIVSTAIGAEGIDVENGKSILLADSPADFAAAVLRVLDDPALARSMGETGRALVCDRYSWDAVTQRLERFFAEVLEGKRTRAAS